MNTFSFKRFFEEDILENKDEIKRVKLNNTLTFMEDNLEDEKEFVIKFLCPNPLIPYLIGRGGIGLSSLSNDSGARLRISGSKIFYPYSNERIIIAKGTKHSIELFSNKIIEKILKLTTEIFFSSEEILTYIENSYYFLNQYVKISSLTPTLSQSLSNSLSHSLPFSINDSSHPPSLFSPLQSLNLFHINEIKRIIEDYELNSLNLNKNFLYLNKNYYIIRLLISKNYIINLFDKKQNEIFLFFYTHNCFIRIFLFKINTFYKSVNSTPLSSGDSSPRFPSSSSSSSFASSLSSSLSSCSISSSNQFTQSSSHSPYFSQPPSYSNNISQATSSNPFSQPVSSNPFTQLSTNSFSQPSFSNPYIQPSYSQSSLSPSNPLVQPLSQSTSSSIPFTQATPFTQSCNQSPSFSQSISHSPNQTASHSSSLSSPPYHPLIPTPFFSHTIFEENEIDLYDPYETGEWIVEIKSTQVNNLIIVFHYFLSLLLENK